jgi:hypothetical protein
MVDECSHSFIPSVVHAMSMHSRLLLRTACHSPLRPLFGSGDASTVRFLPLPRSDLVCYPAWTIAAAVEETMTTILRNTMHHVE